MVTLRLTQERTGIAFQLKPTSTPLGGILALFKVQAWTCVIFGCVTIHVLTSRPENSGLFRQYIQPVPHLQFARQFPDCMITLIQQFAFVKIKIEELLKINF